jgi:hypothetical protein
VVISTMSWWQRLSLLEIDPGGTRCRKPPSGVPRVGRGGAAPHPLGTQRLEASSMAAASSAIARSTAGGRQLSAEALQPAAGPITFRQRLVASPPRLSLSVARGAHYPFGCGHAAAPLGEQPFRISGAQQPGDRCLHLRDRSCGSTHLGIGPRQLTGQLADAVLGCGPPGAGLGECGCGLSCRGTRFRPPRLTRRGGEGSSATPGTGGGNGHRLGCRARRR